MSKPDPGVSADDLPEPDSLRDEGVRDEAPARPQLEPIGTVRRELVRPDGQKVSVDVPVYPPFRLEDATAAAANARPKPPRRVRPGAKPRPTGSD